MVQPLAATRALDGAAAWTLLRALARAARAGEPVTRPCGLSVDASGALRRGVPDEAWIRVEPERERFSSQHPLDATAVQLLSLYLPICTGARAAALVIGQVGQSLDGQIATACGAGRSVSGPETILHLHRLRALCDAVLVGAVTVERDDPLLTTRLVAGDSPTRVVVDPRLRLLGEHKIFQDASAPTLVVCARGRTARRSCGTAEIVEVAADGPVLRPHAILAALQRRGLMRIFVEGGGVTVSRFLQAHRLDRLHVTVSPLLLGRGRPGISLTDVEGFAARRARRHCLGDDLLFDFRLPRGD